MRIGYHAPLPPAPTGVADYAQALFDALGAAHAEPAAGARQADAHLYQFGNNPLHRPVYQRFLQQPGVALLHDANLHHFYLGMLSREQYIGEFTRQYGDWYSAFAEQAWEQRAVSGADPRYFRFPMLGEVAARATRIVVHNRAAQRLVASHGGAGKSVIIPHLVTPPPEVPAFETLHLRHCHALTGRTYLLAVFGHLRESKRLGPVLRAFRQARRREPSLRLLIAGSFVSTNYAAALDLDQEGVLRTGYLREPDFWRWASAVDACINLRYPSCGETSGISMRLMSLGKPVLVTAGEEHAAFPPSACLPIEPGPAEQAHLEEWMVQLAWHRDWGAHIGEAAAAHLRTHHAPSQVARQFLDVLRQP
ncbi:MAG: glycosyltransferase [Bryobacterales bacterium]|nr:glycosyltransferase [Bryobacterales bacterium]